MPHPEAVTLVAGPRGAQDARRWAVQTCQDIGREELSECAELAVSELVTNAVLHGTPPIRVALRGTHDHPRIEVHDSSPVPPQPASPGGGIDLDSFDLDSFDEADLGALTAFGRGLEIVARASLAWGAMVEDDGKAVWFEPAAAFSDGAGAAYQLDHVKPPRGDEQTLLGEIAIQVNGVPVHEFGRFQRHYRDLRREIRLLAMAHEHEYPLAKVLSEHFNALELPLRANMGREQIDAARNAGRLATDLRLRMAPDVARQVGGLIDLLDAADDFSRAERLLTAPRTPEQRSFQIWFLSEFRRQAAGAAPVAWQGRSEGSGTASTINS